MQKLFFPSIFLPPTPSPLCRLVACPLPGALLYSNCLYVSRGVIFDFTHCQVSVAEELRALRGGLCDVVPRELLEPFDPAELETLLAGEATVRGNWTFDYR